MYNKIKILLLLITFYSCSKESKSEKKNFSFHITQPNIYINTFKSNGNFLVFFSNSSSKSKDDFIEFKITSADAINVVFDKRDSKNIYVLNSSYLKKIQNKKFNIHVLNDSIYHKNFFEVYKNTEPKVLKKGYKLLFIFTMEPNINLKDEKNAPVQIN